MTPFFLLAALLVVVALLILLTAPLRARAAGARESDLRATNISLARTRRRELTQALEQGAIEQDVHDDELSQLEHDLASELEGLPEIASRDGTVPALILVGILVPVAAGALYLHLGDPGAVLRSTDAGLASANGSPEALPDSNASSDAEEGSARQAPALADLLPRLEERLATEPDDIDGWRLLGRTYLGIEEFDRAAGALRRAVALDEKDASTLGQLAEAVAMSRGGELAGEPVELLDRVLMIDPLNAQGLWLRAIADQQVGEHAQALERFEALRRTISSDAAALATVDDMMARSRADLGVDTGSDVVADTTSDTETDVPVNSAGQAASDAEVVSLAVSVSISDDAIAAVSPDDTVFVYARASSGPPMPLAVARLTVADLPASIVLDESMAMMPSMSLSDFDAVTVGARVSLTGNAVAASGDWFAEQTDIAIEDGASPVTLKINRQQP